MVKKKLQLGMNPGTASHRLVKDILFQFVAAAGHKCHRCGEDMDRDTFSIDHKTPWLDTEDPAQTFFDLGNIAYSHKACNFRDARRGKVYFTAEEKSVAQLAHQKNWRERHPAVNSERRADKYKRLGT